MRRTNSRMNKVALITGAGGGIGSVVAKALSSNGYKLSLLDINITAADSESVLAQVCDVTCPESVQKAVAKTSEKGNPNQGTAESIAQTGRRHADSREKNTHRSRSIRGTHKKTDSCFHCVPSHIRRIE